jgi:hypothetical protein
MKSLLGDSAPLLVDGSNTHSSAPPHAPAEDEPLNRARLGNL